MTAILGTYSLVAALLLAVFGFVAALAAARFDSEHLLRTTRRTIGLLTCLLTISSLALLAAFLRDNFRLDYVAENSERALPLVYKLAAFWAGQQGSLLLWAWLVAILSSIAAFSWRKEKGVEQAITLSVLMAVCAFFAALMLFAAKPFEAAAEAPQNGLGLNPLLQTWAMAVHPPPLFLGYAASTIPFALTIGGLAAGRLDGAWILRIRRWMLVAWLFLGIGIILGAEWAYEELAFGGYWKWDPVENASLLPWLVATATLHSLMVQQYRGMFKKSNAALAAGTFVLCIVSTYLTRSGVVSSVHSFGESLVGTFFLYLLLTSVALTAVMLVLGRKQLRSERELTEPISRDGAFLAVNLLLILITLVTLIGTIFPVLSRLFTDHQIEANEHFYNKIVIPMALVLVGLMAFGPFLGYGRQTVKRRALALVIPVILGHAAMVLAAVQWKIHNPWALACIVIVTIGVCVLVADFVRSLWARIRSTGENPLRAVLRLFDNNHRRYGGQLVHLGMLMIVVGVAGSGLFGETKDLQLDEGQSGKVGPYSITLNGWAMEARTVDDEPVKDADQAADDDAQASPGQAKYMARQATLAVSGPDGATSILRPEQRFYGNRPDEPTSRVAIEHRGMQGDLYLILAGATGEAGRTASIRAKFIPQISWIWIGGIVLSLGGSFCLLPRLAGGRAEAGPEMESASQTQVSQEPAPRNPAPQAEQGAKAFRKTEKRR